MGISKITRNNQITIPKDVRKIKNLKEGDSVLFVIEGEKVGLVKMDKDLVKSSAGIWRKTKKTGAEYERNMREGWKKRLRRETK